jgi:hypothetical protein
MVAIVVAGLVASMAAGVLLWAYRQGNGSLGVTDRIERRQTLRQGLFQLGRQGRTLALSPNRWTLFKRTPEGEDTVLVECRDTALVRGETNLSPGDSVLACRFEPVFPHAEPGIDPWPSVVGSSLEPPGTDTLALVRLRLVLKAHEIRGAPPQAPDTLDLRIPL